MKLSSVIPPLSVWKEHRSFVLQNRPQPIPHGWKQFRIMIYLTGGLMGCWELGKLSPRRSSDAPGFFTMLGFSLLFALFLAYGLPLVTYLAPCFISLYPNYLAIRRGLSFRYYRFGLISGYKFEREKDGWILKLFDLDEKEAMLAIPNDDVKTKVEYAFTAAGVPRNGLDPAITAQRRKADEQFQAQLKTYRTGARKYDRSTGSWFVGILFLNAILSLIATYYFPKNTALAVVELLVLSAVIIGYGVMVVRYKKRLARASDLKCPHCARLEINQSFMQTLALSHTCAYCGKLFYQLNG